MRFAVPGVLHREMPSGMGLPILVDSPHSGSFYPEDFGATCPESVVREAEDSFVDQLFAEAPRLGAGLVCATFGRSYVDVNRAEDDLDAAMLAEAWPVPLRPSAKTLGGAGLLRRFGRDGTPLYDRLLPAAAVRRRLDSFYRPYHAILDSTLDTLQRHHGAVWHINAHSMPAHSDDGFDFVIGTRDGDSCEAAFAGFVAACLRAGGWRVGLNHPFKGMEIVRRHGQPEQGRHSLQLEVSRRLYMNETSREIHGGFGIVRGTIAGLLSALGSYVQAQLRASRPAPLALAAE